MSREALIKKFRSVGLERLERMNSLLVDLERTPDDTEGVEELMREIHTLKGEAKMMGFADINLVAHQTENLLLAIVDDGVIVDTDPIDLLFEGLDLMRDLLTKSAADPHADLDLTGFVDRIAAYQPDGDDSTDTTAAGDDSVEDVDQRDDEQPDDEPLGDSRPDDDGDESDAPPESGPPSTHTRISGDDLSAPEDRSGPSTGSLRIQTSSALRVDVEKLERLGDVAGETLLMSRRLDYHLDELDDIRRRFRQLMDAVDDHLPKKRTRDLRQIIHRLDSCETSIRDANYEVNRHAAQVDDEARHLRHVPLAQVLSHYPRAVRDLADAQGKNVRLVHSFGNVEVDRTILSALSEPLLHLVRNAVDHGIEPPEQREAAGKDVEGEITLSAGYYGDAIRVQLSDDGRGIDPAAIRKRAVDTGMMSQREAQGLSDQAAIALIFESGFSTRNDVSDISGRGVGMNVVRRQITEIGGFIEAESEVGQGTTFTLHLPVSSAINSVLLFVIGQQRFALTSKDVERVAMVDKAQLKTIHGGVCLEIDDELMSMVDWAGPLGLDQRGDPPERLTVLVVRKGARRIAVWVDDVIGEREAISRPLDSFLEGVELCRGVALTDSGAVVPLLNTVELMKHASTASALQLDDEQPSEKQRSFTAISGRQAVKARTILVVEDSEVTRSLVVSILQDHNYRILEADDGRHAWNRLNKHHVDLVLTDIQMPRMDGLQLLQKIRGSDDYADLPVVILTTLGEPEDKKRAMGLGANGYLVKLSFQEEDLLETVNRHIG